MIKGIATMIILFTSLPIAYRYKKLTNKKRLEVKSLVKAGNYSKGLLNED